MAKLLPYSLVKMAPRVHQKYLMRGVACNRKLGAATVSAIQDSVPTQAKPFDQIPGVMSLPFIGTSWVFYPIVGKYNKHKGYLYDMDKYKRFGDIARDVFGGEPIINLYSAQDIETLLRAESKFPERGFLATLQAYREMRKDWFKTGGVLLLNGKEWYDLRFKLQRHLMKPRTIDKYIGPTTEVARDFINRISESRNRNDEIEDVLEHLFKWSFESVGLVGLDHRFGCLDERTNSQSDGQRMIDAVKEAFECMNDMEPIIGSGIQLWKYFPTPKWSQLVKAMDCFSETAHKYVQKSVDRMKSKSIEDENVTLLEAMIGSGDIEPHEAMVMAIDMLMGGVDTTSNAVAFLLHHLATNPDKQEKLYRDILRLLPDASSELTSEILSEMRYLKLCFKESQRLEPIARIIVRTLPCDLIFSGYHVPAGTKVTGMIQICGRIEKYYKDANQFIPERWEDKAHKPSPFLSLPFGFGTRSCIGRRIAEIEIWTLTTEIIRNFKVEFRQNALETTTRMATVVKTPARFAFIKRK